ncbi:SusE domain-containing protein [Autumnicola musiva]|uniref:SusF/SusE family outer membrane protein n=1 Tax=Autumnicola musiva TaxID=3075589 RepID=A0ABU3D4U7_9FLAO|nr:SusF/SusE family outer membrane protein [Zunongwangia sp. F117]MDT0676555.1 SusF/SusE family outer membrane protein [Zunongwangia sp. F117]
MKRAFLYIITFVNLIGFTSCEEEDSLNFTAVPDPEGVSFENSFQPEYLLSEETETNIAERFFWNPVNFDAPVNVSYDLLASTDPDFGTSEIIATTTNTNQAVTVEQLLGFAEDMGLDNDPETTGDDGLPNNTGEVYFRVHAYTGTGTANSIDVMSDIQPLTVTWIERAPVGAGCDPIYIVGAAAVDAGWEWSSPIVFNCDSNVYTSNLELTNDTFRFFENEGDWESGLSYTYYVEEGYTIDPLLENAEDGDSNFYFNGTPGIYNIVVDNNAKTITVEESDPYILVGDAVPGNWSFDGAVQAEETAPYIRTATLPFNSGIFRFFTESGNWDSSLNYAYFDDLGYTIDDEIVSAEDADGNLSFIGEPGSYTITINSQEKTITLE